MTEMIGLVDWIAASRTQTALKYRLGGGDVSFSTVSTMLEMRRRVFSEEGFLEAVYCQAEFERVE